MTISELKALLIDKAVVSCAAEGYSILDAAAFGALMQSEGQIVLQACQELWEKCDTLLAAIMNSCVANKVDVRPAVGFCKYEDKRRKETYTLQELVPGCTMNHSDILSLTQRVFDKLEEIRKANSPQVFADYKKFVRERVISKNKLLMAKVGEVSYLTEDGVEANMTGAVIEKTIEYECHQYNLSRPKGSSKLEVGGAKSAFVKIRESFRDEQMADLRAHLKYDPAKVEMSVNTMREFIKRMNLKQDDDVALAALQQAIWLTKRYMFRRPVRYEIWVQLLGKEAIGKNVATRKFLFGPVKAYYLETELSKLEDFDREVSKFSDALLVNFDELTKGGLPGIEQRSGLSQDTMKKVKAMMTREEFKVRVMGGQEQMTIKKTFSFFSTANVSLVSVLGDDSASGNRRFLELESKNEARKIWGVDDLIDLADDMWRGIDEGNDHGYLTPDSDVGRKVAAIQNTYDAMNSMKAWALAETEEVEVAEGMSSSECYSMYSIWSKQNGYSPYSRGNFEAWALKRHKYSVDAKGRVRFGVKLLDEEGGDVGSV